MRVERLAWLACRDEMERRSRRWYETLGRILGARHSAFTVTRAGRIYPSVTGELARDDRLRRLGVLEFAVDDVAQTLSADEQAELRAAGTLPAWFIGAALKHAKAVKREMERAR